MMEYTTKDRIIDELWQALGELENDILLCVMYNKDGDLIGLDDAPEHLSQLESSLNLTRDALEAVGAKDLSDEQ